MSEEFYLAICVMAMAFLCGFIIGHWLGLRAGIVGGYGAVMWPDSAYFAKPRQWLNSIRKKDGLPPIEESV